MKKTKEKFIPSIYNYCDRWCERCTFTSRCRNYEGTSKLSLEQKDIHNKAFWDNISNNFEQATKLLYKAVEKYGIDLDAITPEENAEYDRQEKNTGQAADKHILSKLSLDYADKAGQLLENRETFKQKMQDMLHHVQLGLVTKQESLHEAAMINDNLEIIQWYMYFIHIKFQRALHGLIEDDGWEEANGFQRDCDGSAKIALIAVDRSIQAWILLHEQISDSEEEIMDVLAILQKIKRLGEKEFPKAQDFVRPGFDEQ